MEKTSLTPRSHNVAIVGFPKSGKTTLIISLFGEAFARNLPISMIPRGSRTIELVNSSLEMLNKGKSLGPTEDQDLFAFRADITLKRHSLSITYKVEFGDFPGKHSESYSEKNGPWLHTSEFFKWVADSDAIIFVVDLGKYLPHVSRADYVARMTSTLRAAWQHYLDVNSYRVDQVRQHPITIAFTKSDLMQRTKPLIDPDHLKQGEKASDIFLERKIAEFGFGNRAPPLIEIDQEIFAHDRERIEMDFAELIKYFKDEAPNTHIVFTSSFGVMNNKRLGIGELLLSVFP